MRSSFNYAGFAQLCARSAIMRKIMRAHNRIIPRSLLLTVIYSAFDLYTKVLQWFVVSAITEFSMVWGSNLNVPEKYKVIHQKMATSLFGKLKTPRRPPN